MLKDKRDFNQFSLKLKLTLTCEFNTQVAFDIIQAHYSHPVQVIQTQNNLTKFYEELLDTFNAWVDRFQERDSGHVFRKIISVQVKQYKYTYQKGSSYMSYLPRASKMHFLPRALLLKALSGGDLEKNHKIRCRTKVLMITLCMSLETRRP